MKRRLYIPNKGISTDYGESKIYTISNGIYKEFKENISFATRRQKKKRLIYLEQFEELNRYYPQIKYFVEPIPSLYIKGYVMENVETKFLDTYSLSATKKVIILKQIKELLNTFRNIGLMYYDIHYGNVGYNPTTDLPFFYDIDSILFEDEIKPDIIPCGLEDYKLNGGKLDIGFQRYKFNLMAKEVLRGKKDLSFDEIGQKMLEPQFNPYDPNVILTQEYITDHVKLK